MSGSTAKDNSSFDSSSGGNIGTVHGMSGSTAKDLFAVGKSTHPGVLDKPSVREYLTRKAAAMISDSFPGAAQQGVSNEA